LEVVAHKAGQLGRSNANCAAAICFGCLTDAPVYDEHLSGQRKLLQQSKKQEGGDFHIWSFAVSDRVARNTV
jgi:hypothetical protein